MRLSVAVRVRLCAVGEISGEILMDEVVAPFALQYIGKDADSHVVNTVYLGQSLSGAGRLYTAVSHYVILGTLPRGNYRKEFACFSRPSEPGSYEAWLVIATLIRDYNLHGVVYKQAASFLLARIVEAIKDIWTKKGKVDATVESLVELLKEQARKDRDVEMVLANGLVHSNDNLASLHGKLIETLPQMAEAYRGAGRELVAPIGPTCRGVIQFAGTNNSSTITEPDAEVIRSFEDLEVGEDMESFRCNRITELNLSTGHCILEIEGLTGPIKGTITDPAIKGPHSIYSSAMDGFLPFAIEAKRVQKNGELHRLYVSNARQI